MEKNATVPVEPAAATVAVKVTGTDACAVVGVNTNPVAVAVDAVNGVIVMVPLPVLPAPRNRVDSADDAAHDDPPPPPPPGILVTW